MRADCLRKTPIVSKFRPQSKPPTYEAEPAGNGAWGDPLQSLDRGEVAGYSELELSEIPDEADRY